MNISKHIRKHEIMIFLILMIGILLSMFALSTTVKEFPSEVAFILGSVLYTGIGFALGVFFFYL